jgi:hypothetical protein
MAARRGNELYVTFVGVLLNMSHAPPATRVPIARHTPMPALRLFDDNHETESCALPTKMLSAIPLDRSRRAIGAVQRPNTDDPSSSH